MRNSLISKLLLITMLFFPLIVQATEKVDTKSDSKKRLVVLTSYPEEVFSHFEAAFEQKYPDINIDILWQRPRDKVLSYLQQHNGVDVYWAPSRHNFSVLGKAGLFQKLTIDRSELPNQIGHFQLADPTGYYLATEVAGFGFIINPDYLTQHQLPTPHDWTDLTNPIYIGHIVFPIPSKVGFAPAIIDLLLQVYGWQGGWALLSEIVNNSTLMDFSKGETIIDRVANGHSGIGLTIDFFAASKIASDNKLQFIYPKLTAYSPAYVAILADTTAPKEAQQFVEFLVSEEGQTILFDPDIRKLPVRPSIYQFAPEGYYNPFQAVQVMDGFFFDNQLGIASQDTNVALFDQLFTDRQSQLKQAYQLLRQAENLVNTQHNPYWWQQIQQAKMLIVSTPLTAYDAANPMLQQTFNQRKTSAEIATQASLIEKQWGTIIEQNYQRAMQLAQILITSYY